MQLARKAPTSAPPTGATLGSPRPEPRVSGVRELLGKSSEAARAPSVPPPPRMPNIPVTAKSEPPLPLKVRRAKAALVAPHAQVTPERESCAAAVPGSCNTMAIRIEEIRSIAREVAAREADAKKAARLHAVGIRLDGAAVDESALALGRMFPHLNRPSPLTIAVRVVFFLGYLAVALWCVGLRALRQTPRLAMQARDGLRAAWMRAAFRYSEKHKA